MKKGISFKLFFSILPYGKIPQKICIERKTSLGKHKFTTYAPSGIISSSFEIEVKQDKAFEMGINSMQKTGFIMFLKG